MNTRTHNALKALSGAGSLTWKALIPKVELQRRLAKAGDTLSISILILGPASVGEQLARDLGRYQLFLQQPHAKPVGILYENPQCFRFAEGILTTGAVLPPLLLEKSNRRNANSSPDFVLGDIENDEAAPEDQLGPIYFDETDFKGSIKTELQR
ncbi:hypothetical protein BJY04DRAFT_193456 [Aspergillus karnatakaensis]|uniref:uncharacterized protein n=1 Tax=Aspergillus karnatakaensis TaxID=1810916 RepID=UPI003CCD2A48